MKVSLQSLALSFLLLTALSGCGGGGTATTTPSNSNSTTRTAPNTPTGVTISGVTGTTAVLTWTAASGGTGGVASYTIYRNGVAIGHTTKTGTLPAPTSYSDSTLLAGATYVYTVTASDPFGDESAQSAAATLLPTTAGVGLNGYALQPGETAPTQLTVSMIAGKTFAWGDASTRAYGQITFPVDGSGNPARGSWTQWAPTISNATTQWNASATDATTMPIIITSTTPTGALLDAFNIVALGPSYYVVTDARANTQTKEIYRLYYSNTSLADAKAYSGN